MPEAFPSRGADAPTTARGGTCSSIGLLICTGRRPKGLQGASGKPTVSINVRQLCRKETDSGGLTRRLRRGRWGFRPEGGRTFFRSERKYQRKPAARRLREKALYCPFLKEGVRNVARSTVERPTFTFVRARAHSFPLSKRARLFPSAAYRRSAPPQLAAGKRPLAGWEASLWPEGFAAWINGLIFFSPQLAWGRLNPCGLGCFLVAWVFLPRKRPAGFQIHAGLFKRAMRPVAEWRYQLANRQGDMPDPRAARPVAERR